MIEPTISRVKSGNYIRYYSSATVPQQAYAVSSQCLLTQTQMFDFIKVQKIDMKYFSKEMKTAEEKKFTYYKILSNIATITSCTTCCSRCRINIATTFNAYHALFHASYLAFIDHMWLMCYQRKYTVKNEHSRLHHRFGVQAKQVVHDVIKVYFLKAYIEFTCIHGFFKGKKNLRSNSEQNLGLFIKIILLCPKIYGIFTIFFRLQRGYSTSLV